MMARSRKFPSWLSRRGYDDRLKQRIATMLSRDQIAQATASKPNLPEEQALDENVLVFPLNRVLKRPNAA